MNWGQINNTILGIAWYDFTHIVENEVVKLNELQLTQLADIILQMFKRKWDSFKDVLDLDYQILNPYRMIGDKEIEEGTVGVRKRGEGDIGAMSIDEFLGLVLRQNAEKVIF